MLPTADWGQAAPLDSSLGHVTGPAAAGWHPCDWGALLSLAADLPETLHYSHFGADKMLTIWEVQQQRQSGLSQNSGKAFMLSQRQQGGKKSNNGFNQD